MTACGKHTLCQQPIRRCPPQCDYPYCKGWQHMDGYHHCAAGGLGVVAEPEPGTPAAVETPAGKPEGEVCLMTAPATPRERLEAVIWRAATVIGDGGKPRQVLGPSAVDAILAAADEYAAAEAGLLTPAERRRVLYDARDDIGGFQPARQTGARP